MPERGSDLVRETMGQADWVMSRVGYVETLRAIELMYGGAGPESSRFRAEWPSIQVVELTPGIADAAVEVASTHGLRSLDAVHLASALALARGPLTLATWDTRLHAAAAAERSLTVLPAVLG